MAKVKAKPKTKVKAAPKTKVKPQARKLKYAARKK